MNKISRMAPAQNGSTGS
ncbi:hypothetical protein CDAR_176531, partial [Caerostris darwini]